MVTLLVPLDTSEIAPRVLSQAETLAARLQARMILFHVIEPIASYVPVGASMDVIAASPPVMEEEQLDVTRNRLEHLAAPLRARGLEVECDAVFGLAADEIVDAAARQKADYIILGSHGHGALFHLFSGSVVTGVLKNSPCPVVVAPVRKQSAA